MKTFWLAILILCPVLKTFPQNTDTLKSPIVIQDTTNADSLRPSADSLKLAKSRPLIPLFPDGVTEDENVQHTISRREIIYNYYRYTGDLLELFPLAFQRSLGVVGQPHEVMLYGNGFNNVSYLTDGLLQNNRFTNSLDLNYIQSESIDSIEIIPSHRSFLYGVYNNPSAVNFVPRENYQLDSKQGPFSRMRYYQAPDEEAMFDATYRTYLARRLVGIFELTNYSTAGRFINSSHGSWKLRTDLTYLLSDNINIKAGYNYNRTETRLFGGIDYDSLNRMIARNLDPQDERKPVLFPTRYQKYHQHQINLSLRNAGLLNISGKTELYYINSLNEQRQNEWNDSLRRESFYVNDLKYDVFGAAINQTFDNKVLNLWASLNTEYTKYKNYEGLNSRSDISSSAVAGRLSLKILNNNLRPSVFTKYLLYDNKGFFGAGADLSLVLNEHFSFYGGASHFTRPGGYAKILTTEVTSYELGAQTKWDNLQVSIKAFDQEFKNHLIYFSGHDFGQFYSRDKSVYGTGIDLKLSIWKLHLESEAAYYKTDMPVSIETNFLPEYNLRGRLFYQDTLFNRNLFLRTGLSSQYTGGSTFISYDFLMTPIYIPEYESTSPVFRVDFFLIGEIRRRAIIYFTFENLFDKEQFSVPGYPLPARGLRLGVSWEFLN